MFDRTFIAPERTEYVTKEVHEQRAPTDESVTLLKEMEAAARAKVIESVRLDSNAFKAVIHYMRSFESHDDIYVCIFDLNGATKEIKVQISSDKSRNDGLIELRDAVAKAIANNFLEQVWATIIRPVK